MEIEWNNLSFYPPSIISTKTLIMEIAAGWKGSPLDNLWEEILLLNCFLSILEEYSKNNMSSRYSVMPLKFPENFVNPNVKVIIKFLLFLIDFVLKNLFLIFFRLMKK